MILSLLDPNRQSQRFVHDKNDDKESLEDKNSLSADYISLSINQRGIMNQINELQKTLTYFLDWNKARISCLSQILHGLFQVRTVNLTQIAETFDTEAKEASAYRKIQRFFKGFSFDLVSKLFLLGSKAVLIMDRTNWKWENLTLIFSRFP